MKTLPQTARTSKSNMAGTTLVDVMFGILATVFLFTSVYLGFTQGFAIIQLARENLRATQILQEKMETVWLYSWDQINTAGFIPRTFTAPFYPLGGNTNSGFTYTGTVTIDAAPLTETYRNDMKVVTVQVRWTSGKVQRQRQMQTLVSRYGMHNYIYFNE